MWETEVQSPCGEDSLEKEMATHSSISCLENPMDRGAWWAIVYCVVEELDTTEHARARTHTHTHKQCSGKKNPPANSGDTVDMG